MEEVEQISFPATSGTDPNYIGYIGVPKEEWKYAKFYRESFIDYLVYKLKNHELSR